MAPRPAPQVTATQPENDIAVLQPDQLPNLLVPAVMGNPNAMRVGDEAFAVGNPFGLYQLDERWRDLRLQPPVPGGR